MPKTARKHLLHVKRKLISKARCGSSCKIQKLVWICENRYLHFIYFIEIFIKLFYFPSTFILGLFKETKKLYFPTMLDQASWAVLDRDAIISCHFNVSWLTETIVATFKSRQRTKWITGLGTNICTGYIATSRVHFVEAVNRSGMILLDASLFLLVESVPFFAVAT